MRRPLTVLATAAALTVLMAVPAWAQPAFTQGEVEADVDARLTLSVPSQPDSGTTTGVVVQVPGAFSVAGCQVIRLGWSCTTEASGGGTRVTFSGGTSLTPIDTASFAIDVHTPPTGGVYAFPTTQRFEDGSSTAFSGGSAPTVTVNGPAGEGDPEGEPGGNDPIDIGGDDDPEESGGNEPEDEATTPPPSSGTGGGSTSGSSGGSTSGSSGGSTSGSSSGGSTGSGGDAGPFRTGRSSGTTFDVTTTTPAEPAPTDDVAAPSVADALAGGTTAAGEEAAGAEEPPGDDDGSAAQRLAGLALLAAGGVAVVVRRRMGRTTV